MAILVVDQPPAEPGENHFAISKTAALALGRLADGNGLKPDQVRLVRHDTTVHPLDAFVRVTLVPVTSHEMLRGNRPVGEVAASKHDCLSRATAAGAQFIEDESVVKAVQLQLERDEGKGWGMQPQKIDLPPGVARDYSVIDKCPTCAGATQVACRSCSGTGRIACTHCAGAPDCPHCRGTRQMNCPACNGARLLPCNDCDRSGFATHHFHARYQAQITFDLLRDKIAPEVFEAINALNLRALATQGHADVYVLPPFAEKDTLLFPYAAWLPLAQAEYSIEGKFSKGTVAGLNGTVIAINDFLDPFVKPGINALLKLSKGPLATDALIAAACKYRMLRETLSGLSHHSQRAVYQKLGKTYPVGLSEKYAKAAVKYAHLALLSVAQVPRRKGLAIGSAAAGVLAALWFATPARGLVQGLLRQHNYGQHILAADILVWVLGYALTVFVIKKFAAAKIARLLPRDEDRGLPAAGDEGLYALGTTFLLWAALAFAVPARPEWLLAILRKFGI